MGKGFEGASALRASGTEPQPVLVGSDETSLMGVEVKEFYGWSRSSSGNTTQSHLFQFLPPPPSKINPFYASLVYLFQIYFTITLPRISRSSTWTLSFILTFCWPCISVYLSQYLTKLMHKICFTISFISCLYMFRAHVLITPIGGRLVHQTVTYRCDDTRGCVMQF